MSEVHVNAVNVAHLWLCQFADAIASGDVTAFVSLFLEQGWLRDNLVFTWSHRSLCGHDAISAYLETRLPGAQISQVKLDDKHGIAPNYSSAQAMVEAAFTFETPKVRGRGLVYLKPHDVAWKALSVYVMVNELKGHEEKDPESGYYDNHVKTWNEVHEEERARIEKDPHVLIIGAGQSGLNVGARFRQMNIPALLIEKTDAVGDVWRKRYPSLTLHTPNPHHSLLYTRFHSNAPKFTARDKVAAMLQQYAFNQDLIIWHRSTMLPLPTYDTSTKRWTVHILKDGLQVILRPYHIVLAMGTLGRPYVPPLPGAEQFKGISLHATDFKGPRAFAGKKAIVVGASQTSSDICQDLATHDAASVTMVQRSSTIVVAAELIHRTQLDVIWPVDVDPSIGDFRAAGLPLGLLKRIMIANKDQRVAAQRDMIDGLLKAGLEVNEGEEGAGQPLRVFERLGGYWMDIGTADLIIEGKIKIKHGTEPERFTPDGLLFKDGSTLDADVVVFATGYEPIKNVVRGMFGLEIASEITPVWGLDEEGECRRAYTPSGHPGIWWAIGDFFSSRYYSKSLAIQIKARELGLIEDCKLLNSCWDIYLTTRLPLKREDAECRIGKSDIPPYQHD